jgi:hypothetical protein
VVYNLTKRDYVVEEVDRSVEEFCYHLGEERLNGCDCYMGYYVLAKSVYYY